jgi:hypothetical protein
MVNFDQLDNLLNEIREKFKPQSGQENKPLLNCDIKQEHKDIAINALQLVNHALNNPNIDTMVFNKGKKVNTLFIHIPKD